MLDGEPVLSWIVPALMRWTGAYGTCAYGIDATVDGLRYRFGWFEGGRTERAGAHFDDWLRRHNRPWGAFDPARPEPSQRNRVVTTPRPSDLLRGDRPPRWASPRLVDVLAHSVETHLRPMDWDHPTARVLLCDGPRLLAYLGLTTRARVAPRQARILRAIAPAVRRRLLQERQLEQAGFAQQAMDAALEAIPAAALLLGANGAVLHANTAAREWLGEVGRSERAALLGRKAPDRRVFDVTEIGAGAERVYLAVRRPSPADPAPLVAHCARRWGLTGREATVLAELARGASNLRIAGTLGIAESTVEIHVSRVLAKADAASRAELVALVWTSARHRRA